MCRIILCDIAPSKSQYLARYRLLCVYKIRHMAVGAYCMDHFYVWREKTSLHSPYLGGEAGDSTGTPGAVKLIVGVVIAAVLAVVKL